MKILFHTTFAAVAALSLVACGGGASQTRDSIRVVGSSTVFPFAKAVSESFARSNPDFGAPIIESTGTGGGIKLFCSGVGQDTPDIANASRRMKSAEFEDCVANGVDEVVELQVGLDGLALASADGGIDIPLTTELIYRALAARPYGEEQTATNWSDLDPSLPNKRILVYGPPSTSGTRDSFEELLLLPGCESNPQMAALKESNEEEFEKICTDIRSDGAYVDQGENDNLIVQKLQSSPDAVGIFGYSYLEENVENLHGLSVNGVKPTYETVASLQYPGAREMFIYVKKAHIDAIPGLRQYLEEWTNMWGEDGPLARIGLIVSPAERLAAAAEAARNLPSLTAADFE